MKPTSSTALATWMLDHLTLGARNESLSGDLLEELHSGRSTAWYWRQTISAIAITLSTCTRAYVVPLLFSAGWSLLYPRYGPPSYTASQPKISSTTSPLAIYPSPPASALSPESLLPHFLSHSASSSISSRINTLAPRQSASWPAYPSASTFYL